MQTKFLIIKINENKKAKKVNYFKIQIYKYDHKYFAFIL